MAIPGASSASPVTDAGTTSLGASGALHWQQAVITAIEPQTERVKSLFFAPSHPFAFRAGQHADVRLTAPDGYRAERSYSIASAPESPDRIELAVERLDDGEVSPFFHDVAEIGDEIELRGPIGGHFVWDVADGGPLLLLGGGSGVVPLMSMIRHRAAQGSAVPALLFYSVRSWDEIIFRDELIALHDRQDGFELVLALTREPARRERDYERRVDTAILAEVLPRLPQAPKQVVVCGANAFVGAAADSAIAAGIVPGIIRTERYGG
jgi:ferredoxin-NADP reductase